MVVASLGASSLVSGASGAFPHVQQPQPPTYEALVEITDLGECRGCAGSIERALDSLIGVQSVVLESERPWLRVVMDSGRGLDLLEIRRVVRDKGYSSGQVRLRWAGSVESDRRSAWPPWPTERPLPLVGGSERFLPDTLPATVFLEAEIHEEEGELGLSLISVCNQGSSH